MWAAVGCVLPWALGRDILSGPLSLWVLGYSSRSDTACAQNLLPRSFLPSCHRCRRLDLTEGCRAEHQADPGMLQAGSPPTSALMSKAGSPGRKVHSVGPYLLPRADPLLPPSPGGQPTTCPEAERDRPGPWMWRTVSWLILSRQPPILSPCPLGHSQAAPPLSLHADMDAPGLPPRGGERAEDLVRGCVEVRYSSVGYHRGWQPSKYQPEPQGEPEMRWWRQRPQTCPRAEQTRKSSMNPTVLASLPSPRPLAQEPARTAGQVETVLLAGPGGAPQRNRGDTAWDPLRAEQLPQQLISNPEASP